MDNEGISCIAVGDMLRNRLEKYSEALAGGADDVTLKRMEDDIDKIEAVHNKCNEMGNVTDVDTSSIVVDEAEGEESIGSSIDEGEFSVEEEEGN